MTLEEFLLTADADHGVALQQARDYAEIQPIFITSNTLTVYVLQAGLYDVFADVAADTSSPVRGICMALMDRLRGQSEFNLSPSLPLGQANIQMLDILISALPDKSAALTQLKNTLLAASNKTVYPLVGTTLHDVLIIRNACPSVPVVTVGVYAVITTTVDCPKHNPRLLALNPRTGVWQPINNFTGVEVAGAYDAIVPAQFSGWQLAVDDAYGVI